MRGRHRGSTRPLPLLGALLIVLLGACGGTPPPGQEAAPSGSGTATGPATAISASSTAPAQQPHILVFTATGTATVDSLTYVVDGETVRERSVSLPWRKSLTVPDDGRVRAWQLTVQIRAGDVKLVAYLDGRVSTQSAAGGTGRGTASLAGSVRS